MEGHTVNNVERTLTGRNRTGTTNHDAAHGTRTLAGGDVHTGSLALQCLEGVVHWLRVHFFFAYACEGTSYVSLALNTVTYNHHFVDELLVFLERHVDRVAAVEGDVLCAIAHIREHEGGIS